MVYGVCLKYLQNEEDSKDAVMDIFEKLSDKLRSHEISYPKSWLYTVTRNHCYEILRKNTRFEEKEINARLMYSEEVFRPFEDEEKEQQLSRLEDCIRKLEPMQQHSIRLFYLEKKTYKEVCEIMSIKWDRARSLIQNGRRNLKICMEA